MRLLSSTSILFPSTTYDALASTITTQDRWAGRNPLPVHLSWIEIETHERKVLRIHRARLYEKLVPPRIQRLETLAVRDIESKDAAVRPSVESHT